MNEHMQELQERYQGLSIFIQDLLLIAAAIAGGIILKGILFGILRFSFRNHKEVVIIQSILKRCSSVLNVLVPLVVLAIVLPFLHITPTAKMYLEKILEVLLIVSFAWLAIKVVYVVQDYINKTFSLEQENNFRARKIITQVQYIRRLLVVGIIVLTLSIILLSFESVRSIGAGLLTSAGVTGIIIGFAAQKSIANLIAGFQIAFTQPIRIDDVVVIEGEFGRIEEITFTYVVMRLWDQRRLVVPINHFIEKPFQNWTRQSSEIMGTVMLYTDYFVPVDALRKELKRLCESSPFWDKKVCVLQVTDSTETALQLRVLISAENSGNAWELRVFLREKLIEFISTNYPESLPTARAILQEQKDFSRAYSASDQHQEKLREQQ